MLSYRTAILGLALAVPMLGGCRQVWPARQPTLSLRHEAVRGQLVIRSEEPLPQDDRLLQELTAQRSELLSLLSLPASSQPIYVYLFASSDRFKEFMRSRYPDLPDRRAFFVERDSSLEVYAHWGDRVAEDLRHEVAHGYLHSVVPRIPLWLDEGLAEYFEVPAAHHGLNAPHVQLLAQRLQSGWQPNLERLEVLGSPGEMDQGDYAEAWAWVHYLLYTSPQHRELIQRYLRDLQQPGTSEPVSARLKRLGPATEPAFTAHVRELSTRR